MRAVRYFVAVALLAGVVVAPAGGRPAQSCVRAVTGGTDAERAAVRRILCLMPGTAIQSVQIVQAPDAPPNALWLGITARHATGTGAAASLIFSRVRWEVDIAAAGIRDGFSRLGLAHVVGYEEVAAGATPVHFVMGIARPEWGLPRWSVPEPARSLGHGLGTWAQLQANLDALSRRFGVRTRLERYSPFGKAPIVTVTTTKAKGGAFIDAGGFAAYEAALHMHEARYDGVFLQLIVPGSAGLQVFTVDRGRRHSGCGGSGTIPHRRYEICPLD